MNQILVTEKLYVTPELKRKKRIYKINFIINILLIPRYGAIGAAIGTVIAEFSVALYQIVKTKEFFDYKKIFINNIKYVFGSIIMFIICYIVNINFHLVGMKQLVIDVCLGIGVYFMFLLIIKDELVYEVLNRFFGGKNETIFKKI